MTRDIEVEVECYAGWRADEAPRRFRVFGRAVEITAELDRWLSPEARYFKVRGDDGAVYILRHDEDAGSWTLSVYSKIPL